MKKWNRFLSLALAGALALSLTACGGGNDDPSGGGNDPAGGGGDEQEVYEIIYAGTVTDTNPITIAFNQMAEQLEERSGGRLKMTLYPNNTLGDTRANIESMQNGTVQIGEGSIAPLAMFTDLYMPMSLPFLFSDWDEVWAFTESEFMQDINDQVAEELGVRVIGWMSNGARCLSNNVRAVSTPADMAGLKIRVMENDIYQETFKALGANPITMSFAELFTGLQQGTVNGQDNATTITNANRFYEVQSYFTDLHHVLDVAPIMVDDAWYQSLPDDLRQIFDETLAENIEYERQLTDEGVEADMEAIATTCEITLLTDEQREAFREACAPVYDWFETQYPDLDLQVYLDAIEAASAG